MSLGYVFLIVYLISTIPHLTIFRDRVQVLRYSKEKRWYTIECIEKTLLQNIGSGIECIDLTGVIYPRYQSNGLEQLKNIRDTQVLVDNSGNVLGNFVITNVEEKQILFFPDGKPRKIEFILKLKSYNK